MKSFEKLFEYIQIRLQMELMLSTTTSLAEWHSRLASLREGHDGFQM